MAVFGCGQQGAEGTRHGKHGHWCAVAKERSDGLQVNRSRGRGDRPQGYRAVRTTGDEGSGVSKADMGELTDMKVLKMAQKLQDVSRRETKSLSRKGKTYLATVRRIEAHASIDETPFHIVIIGWRDIESESSSA